MASSTTEVTSGPWIRPVSGTPTRFPVAHRHGFGDLVGLVAEGAVERELSGRSPYDEVRLLAKSGYGAVRLPGPLGGSGLRLTHLTDLTVDLAAADSNVAHLLRNHFLFVEGILAGDHATRRWLPGVADGLLFGLGFGETEMPRAGEADFRTTLTPDGDGFRLEGVKHYSTGNAYCDLLVVKATRPDGSVATVVVPADREGVELVDDWDGIGQRATASGTTRFHAVRVGADEVAETGGQSLAPSGRGTPFAQLYLSAVVAGIVAAAAHDAVDLVLARTRNYFHGLHEEPRHDPMVQQTVGRLSADAFAARAVVLAAASSLELAIIDPDVRAMERASFDAARAKVTVDEIATRATSALLDAGSASAVRQGLALDRHWRNARTVIAHNPGSYKQRLLGDHALNGTAPPVGSFF